MVSLNQCISPYNYCLWSYEPYRPLAEADQPAVSRGVELEIHGPHLIRICGLVTAKRAGGGPGPLLLAWSWALELILPPETVHPLEHAVLPELSDDNQAEAHQPD
jgi:hypothetical protein